MAVRPSGTRFSASVVALTTRPRARAMIRAALPRRRVRVQVTRSATKFAAAFHDQLLEAALVDIGTAEPDVQRAVMLAREYPSIPFFGIAPYRAADGPSIAHCARHDFADVLADAVDEGFLGHLLATHSFSARFARTFREPPPRLALTSELQLAAWRTVIARGGRSVATGDVARSLAVTREHLSRSFAANGGPNLKRVIDLLRLLAAADLAKNPGYGVADVARLLGFASASHLSAAAQRLVDTRAQSLSALRAVDIIERFVRGRGRSHA
jgi:AraC-like DNA-binding protein